MCKSYPLPVQEALAVFKVITRQYRVNNDLIMY